MIMTAQVSCSPDPAISPNRVQVVVPMLKTSSTLFFEIPGYHDTHGIAPKPGFYNWHKSNRNPVNNNGLPDNPKTAGTVMQNLTP